MKYQNSVNKLMLSLVLTILTAKTVSADPFLTQPEPISPVMQSQCLFEENRYREVSFKRDILVSMTDALDSDSSVIFNANQDYRVLGLYAESQQTAHLDAFGVRINNEREVFVDVLDSNRQRRLVHSSYLNIMSKLRIKAWKCQ